MGKFSLLGSLSLSLSLLVFTSAQAQNGWEEGNSPADRVITRSSDPIVEAPSKDPPNSQPPFCGEGLVCIGEGPFYWCPGDGGMFRPGNQPPAADCELVPAPSGLDHPVPEAWSACQIAAELARTQCNGVGGCSSGGNPTLYFLTSECCNSIYHCGNYNPKHPTSTFTINGEGPAISETPR